MAMSLVAPDSSNPSELGGVDACLDLSILLFLSTLPGHDSNSRPQRTSRWRR